MTTFYTDTTDGEYIIRTFKIGTVYWLKNGDLHRDEGPAAIYPDGYRSWYQNGELHRLDGPAVESTDGEGDEWFIEDRQVDCKTQEEFDRLIKLKAFL